jgi:hypothetical protein
MNFPRSAVHSDGKTLIFENQALYCAWNKNKHIGNKTKCLILILAFGRMIASLPVWNQGTFFKNSGWQERHHKN